MTQGVLALLVLLVAATAASNLETTTLGSCQHAKLRVKSLPAFGGYDDEVDTIGTVPVTCILDCTLRHREASAGADRIMASLCANTALTTIKQCASYIFVADAQASKVIETMTALDIPGVVVNAAKQTTDAAKSVLSSAINIERTVTKIITAQLALTRCVVVFPAGAWMADTIARLGSSNNIAFMANAIEPVQPEATTLDKDLWSSDALLALGTTQHIRAFAPSLSVASILSKWAAILSSMDTAAEFLRGVLDSTGQTTSTTTTDGQYVMLSSFLHLQLGARVTFPPEPIGSNYEAQMMVGSATVADTQVGVALEARARAASLCGGVHYHVDRVAQGQQSFFGNLPLNYTFGRDGNGGAHLTNLYSTTYSVNSLSFGISSVMLTQQNPNVETRAAVAYGRDLSLDLDFERQWLMSCGLWSIRDEWRMIPPLDRRHKQLRNWTIAAAADATDAIATWQYALQSITWRSQEISETNVEAPWRGDNGEITSVPKSPSSSLEWSWFGFEFIDAGDGSDVQDVVCVVDGGASHSTLIANALLSLYRTGGCKGGLVALAYDGGTFEALTRAGIPTAYSAGLVARAEAQLLSNNLCSGWLQTEMFVRTALTLELVMAGIPFLVTDADTVWHKAPSAVHPNDNMFVTASIATLEQETQVSRWVHRWLGDEQQPMLVNNGVIGIIKPHPHLQRLFFRFYFNYGLPNVCDPGWAQIHWGSFFFRQGLRFRQTSNGCIGGFDGIEDLQISLLTAVHELEASLSMCPNCALTHAVGQKRRVTYLQTNGAWLLRRRVRVAWRVAIGLGYSGIGLLEVVSTAPMAFAYDPLAEGIQAATDVGIDGTKLTEDDWFYFDHDEAGKMHNTIEEPALDMCAMVFRECCISWFPGRRYPQRIAFPSSDGSSLGIGQSAYVDYGQEEALPFEGTLATTKHGDVVTMTYARDTEFVSTEQFDAFRRGNPQTKRRVHSFRLIGIYTNGRLAAMAACRNFDIATSAFYGTQDLSIDNTVTLWFDDPSTGFVYPVTATAESENMMIVFWDCPRS